MSSSEVIDSNLREKPVKHEEVRANNELATFESFLDLLISKSPENISQHLIKAKPFVLKAYQFFIHHIIPSIYAAYGKLVELKKQLEPYHLHVLFPSVVGLILCFFGGSFMTLISAVEAYRMVMMIAQQ